MMQGQGLETNQHAQVNVHTRVHSALSSRGDVLKRLQGERTRRLCASQYDAQVGESVLWERLDDLHTLARTHAPTVNH